MTDPTCEQLDTAVGLLKQITDRAYALGALDGMHRPSGEQLRLNRTCLEDYARTIMRIGRNAAATPYRGTADDVARRFPCKDFTSALTEALRHLGGVSDPRYGLLYHVAGIMSAIDTSEAGPVPFPLGLVEACRQGVNVNSEPPK